jgi:hypothetical protein
MLTAPWPLTGYRSSTKPAARLRSAAAGEAAVLAEIGAMGSAEVEAMSKWASAGCHGEMPSPDLKQRRALAEKPSAAQSAAAAATGAGQDINHQITLTEERLATINAQIELTIFDQVEREHGDIISEFVGVCERGSQLATQISGLALLFRETGNNRRAAVIFAAKLPMISTSPNEVQAAADTWGRRVADLRRGSAS